MHDQLPVGLLYLNPNLLVLEIRNFKTTQRFNEDKAKQ